MDGWRHDTRRMGDRIGMHCLEFGGFDIGLSLMVFRSRDHDCLAAP
jgi:hypothetical protein